MTSSAGILSHLICAKFRNRWGTTCGHLVDWEARFLAPHFFPLLAILLRDKHRSTSVLSRFAEPGKSPAAPESVYVISISQPESFTKLLVCLATALSL